METWQMELDFLTHEEYEKQIRKANGTYEEQEFEGASDQEIAEFLEQAEREAEDIGELAPSDEWEEVKDEQEQ